MAAPTDDRKSPLVVQIILLVAFLLVVVVAIFTVVIPDVTDEPDPETTGRGDAGPS